MECVSIPESFFGSFCSQPTLPARPERACTLWRAARRKTSVAKLVRTVPSCRQSKLSISKRTGSSDKCLEATQLKTVRTVIVVLRVDPIAVEVQEVGIGARNRRRPAVPVVADVTQSTETAGTHSVAVAREPTITSSQTNVRAAAWLLGRREREKGEFRFPPVFFGNAGRKARTSDRPADEPRTSLRVRQNNYAPNCLSQTGRTHSGLLNLSVRSATRHVKSPGRHSGRKHPVRIHIRKRTSPPAS